jgi:hypothetical protein
MNVRTKLVFVLGKPLKPSLMFEPTQEKHLIGVGSGLTSKYWSMVERLARGKQSSLLLTFVKYGRKKFHNIGPRKKSLGRIRCQFHKHFYLCNLQP